jgi:hypothetical protein
MKLGKLKVWVTAFALVACLGPNLGWSTHLIGGTLTGQVTATPLEGEIEIDHHVYRISANSRAEKTLHDFSAGLTVDVILDGPAANSTSRVVSITRHAGT